MTSRNPTLQILAAGVAWALLSTATAAQPMPAGSASAAASGPTRSLALGRGKSAVIELPVDARDVLVTNPKVADAVLRTPRRIFILGVESGQTDAVFFDQMGRRILTVDIRVDLDTNAVGETIRRMLPKSRITVEAVNNSLVLSGSADSASDADAAMRIAQQFVLPPGQVLNLVGITGKEQVMLKVRVVEVQRTAIKQLGFDLNAVVGRLNDFQFAYSQIPSFGVNGAPAGGTQTGVGSFNRRGEGGSAALQAFERVGLVRTLAEPNLTAVSGESAKFLAGGEYPVPVGQDSTGRITVEFKPFGVGLGFTPTVLSEGKISLNISTEVSELTNDNAFSVGVGQQRLVIPALNVRRAQTVVELPSGGSMMIAGLLQSKSKQAIDSVPGVGALPVLGALFRSRDFQNGETELVIIVTPYLVDPTNPSNLQTPADGLQLAGDGQAVLLGKLNKVTKGGSQAVQGRTYQGPYGYIIE